MCCCSHGWRPCEKYRIHTETPQWRRRPAQCRYAFQLWKPLGQVITQTAKKFPSTAFSAYYKGGFEQKMTKREASLILGISPTSTKMKVREAHRRIMVLNHPDKAIPLLLQATLTQCEINRVLHDACLWTMGLLPVRRESDGERERERESNRQWISIFGSKDQ
ncbi:dnaJ homolog subfamily C member 15 isoform X2 [Electrophorus electricus]|uniref:dnaJ homolog subfamily C member 15 isoform X2 n=1 Tax=Electrophorus electricus TaxID=8005 RepID=UPI0015D08CC8|nr:dnaJ homolog subfamily C member 15 isoform X2 [Electrophorus electricus]